MINKCKNLESTKRPGVNFWKVRSKDETTRCAFGHHPVRSRANVQRVIDRWSQTWSEATRHHNTPKKSELLGELGCALEVERSTCRPETAQFELRRSEITKKKRFFSLLSVISGLVWWWEGRKGDRNKSTTSNIETCFC